MYLSDVDIKVLLPQLQITCRDSAQEFTTEQIQPCSIDFRLDKVFWRQKRRRTHVDLRRSVVQELDARRYWRRVEIDENSTITLKPRELILGRVYEKFTIPNGYAGKIEGRSSFARLGLSVHCSGDFVNPGYRGHMPLQLVNMGNTDIRLSPHLPICQLVLVKLTTHAERMYGHDELNSKYMDDDGGPSYWWKDKHVKKLQQFLSRKGELAAIQEELFQLVSKRDISLIERFETFVQKCRTSDYTNARELLKSLHRPKREKRNSLQLDIKSRCGQALHL